MKIKHVLPVVLLTFAAAAYAQESSPPPTTTVVAPTSMTTDQYCNFQGKLHAREDDFSKHFEPGHEKLIPALFYLTHAFSQELVIERIDNKNGQEASQCLQAYNKGLYEELSQQEFNQFAPIVLQKEIANYQEQADDLKNNGPAVIKEMENALFSSQ